MIRDIRISIRKERVKYSHKHLAELKDSHLCTEEKKHSSKKIKGETNLKTRELLNFTTACKQIYQHIG